MKVRLTRQYTPPPEWGQLPYPEGLVVHGELAAHALRDGAAIPFGPDVETKVTPPTEFKRRGRPPKVKAE
jgi:hypothetical protein